MSEPEDKMQLPDSENPHAAEFAVLAALQTENAELKDQRLRALAEVENIRRIAAIVAVLDGIEATDRQLISTLEQHGVKQVDTSDGRFDPNLHQAIAEVPGNGKPAGTIVDVVQTGYTISGRLLRPAMVTVARKDDAPAGVDMRT
jgi:molecular chaperone GrpE